MEKLASIVKLLNELLRPEKFNDYCPNGLQVEGSSQVMKVVTGVTASMALIEAAIERQADMVLVHHGYFWKGEAPEIVGLKKRRLACLLKNNISLVAYHLPLDAHPVIGNNAQLANLLGLEVTGGMEVDNPRSIGLQGKVTVPQTAEQFGETIAQKLGRVPLCISPGKIGKGLPEKVLIERVAWCTGAAQNYIEHAVALGADAYLTGEVSEQTVHIAKESGLHFYAAGHHATERYGVKALGEYLAQEASVEVEFVDIPNPV